MERLLLAPLLLALLPSCAPAGGDDDDEDDRSDIVGILLTPEEVVVPVGQELQLRATGLTDDRESVDLTASVRWTSSDEAVLSVSNDLDQEGLAVGLQAGTATVEAEVDGVEAVPLTVTVTDAGVERLAVYPSSLDLAPGDAVQLVATAWWSDGSESDATGQVRWITGDGAVATLSAEGLLTAQAEGETAVHAEWGEASSGDVPVVVSAGGGSGGGGQPDLTITAASGAVSGGTLDLSVTLKNAGDAAAADFWVDVYVDRGTPDIGDVGDDFTWVTWLDGEGTTTLSFQVPVGEGSHEVAILADTNDDVAESAEGNNLYQATVGTSGGGSGGSKANLEISYFDFLYDEDWGEVYYYVDVANTGGTAAGEFYVDVWVDRDDAPALYEDGDDWVTIHGLSAGDVTWADFLIEDAWCSWCWSWVMIDGYDTVDESDEGDNVEGPLDVY